VVLVVVVAAVVMAVVVVTAAAVVVASAAAVQETAVEAETVVAVDAEWKIVWEERLWTQEVLLVGGVLQTGLVLLVLMASLQLLSPPVCS
jgi:hypothetical protein